MRIWSKYLVLEFLKVFFFFIFSFYFLYVLIDYSSRLQYFSHISLVNTFYYYLCIFLQKAEVLIPFAFMVTLMRVLFSINSHNELTSMLMSGLSYKKLLSPLFGISIILSLFLYANFQFLEPGAQKKIEIIKQEKQSKKEQRIKSFVLNDRSKIVFRNFDLKKSSLGEVFWLKSPDHIYYMKELYPYSNPPIGQYVLEFKRDEMDNLILTNRADLIPFQDMLIEFDPLLQSVFSVRTYSITAIYRSLHNPKVLLNMNSHELLTLLNYKLLLPLLPIFLYFTLVPICTRFSRNIPVFFIYMLSIGGLLSFFTLIDACYFLGGTKLVSPLLVMWLPALVYFGYPVKKFWSY